MHLMVIRFSAMGDVALTRPVLQTILEANNNLTITMVTNKSFKALFNGIDRLAFVGVDLKGEHKGFSGLYKLFRQLRNKDKVDYVIDLHDVVRSWVLCSMFSLRGVKYERIDKGRAEKKQLTDKNDKVLKPLLHSTERYLEVFQRLPIKSKKISLPSFVTSVSPAQLLTNKLRSLVQWPKSTRWIGIAPFSKHVQKEWPMERIKELINQLVDEGNRVLLFGGGPKEIKELETIAKEHPFISNLASTLSLQQEIEVIGLLDVMISMDSFNMHLASLVGTKVLSIWGATHQYAGFGPLGENENRVIQVSTDTLSCRPCSVFGNKPCWRGDLACLNGISTSMVKDRIDELLPIND